MGEVYKATDTRLDRTVAIKVLPAHVANDPDLKQRFEREARTVAALNHPHICTLHDIGTQGGIDFLVMEYLDGQTLAQRLEKGAVPLDQALQIAIEIADALDKAHRQGIVHRDLKPGNIMLTKQGAKLLDFGLAKLKPVGSGASLVSMPTQSAGLTGEGKILGTLQYMAPEQVEGQEADTRTDIFAFGATVYEMVTGKKAFEGKSSASLVGAILKDDPRPITALQPVSPLALDRVVMKCLAKDPEARWHSAHDLHDELKWIANGGDQVRVPASRLAVPQQARWRRALPLVAGIVAASVVTGLGVWNLTRPAARPPTRFAIAVPSGFTTNTGAIQRSQVAISADGRTLVYAGPNELYRRGLGQLEVQPIAATDGALDAFFSPDGQWVGFDDGGGLRKVSLAGGASSPVVEAAVRGASWGVDETIVLGTPYAGLSRVSANGGEPEPITMLAEGEASHRYPDILPSGEAVLFTVLSRSLDTGRIAVVSLETGERRTLVGGTFPRYVSTGHIVFARETLTRLTFDPGFDRLPVWSPDGQRIAFSSQRDGSVGNLFSQVADGTGPVERVAEQNERQVFPTSFSPDATQLLVFGALGDGGTAQDEDDIGIVALEAAGSGGSSTRAVGPLLQTAFGERNAEVSPDGRWVAYESNESGQDEIYVRPFPDVESGRWQVSTGGGTRPLWARNGRELFYYVAPGGGNERFHTSRGELLARQPADRLRRAISFAQRRSHLRCLARRGAVSHDHGSRKLGRPINTTQRHCRRELEPGAARAGASRLVASE